MVTVTFDKQELFDLAGLAIEDELLREVLMGFGADVDSLMKSSISIELLPNRPDLYSVEGLARALALFLGKRNLEDEKDRYTTYDSGIELKVEPVPVRPYIVTATVELDSPLGIDLNLDLIALQEILHKSVCRERKKGAIGLHDLDRVKPPFVYRAVPPDFSFTPLDGERDMSIDEILSSTRQGKEYGHILKGAGGGYPIILDANGEVLSLPPIINGNLTRLETNTKRLFVDVTGTDPVTIENTLKIICCSLVERGGKVGAISTGGEKTPDLSWEVVDFDEKYAKRVLGFSAHWGELLGKMGLELEERKVKIPPYRVDILHPIDVVEDAAIAYGYMNMSPRGPREPTTGKELEINSLTNAVRETLVGMGYQEIVSFVLTSERLNEGAHVTDGSSVEIVNPLSENQSILRSSLIPGLLSALKGNRKSAKPLKLFEVGDVVIGGKNHRRVCAMVMHEGASFTEIKSCAKKLLSDLGFDLEVQPCQHRAFIDGRCGSIIAGRSIGVMGELDIEVLKNFSLEMPVAGLEIELEDFV
jgi:phenylalanyl-tRNA synthetase beta chain